MMKPELLGAALIELADIANVASGDFHCLHFNITGAEFDTWHRKILKKYYEEAAEDFDELNEKARCYGVMIPSPNEAATRLGYQSWQPLTVLTKGEAWSRCAEVLEVICDMYLKLFNTVNQITDCETSVGVASFLQTRIEYWSKEKNYFNKSRED